MVSAIRWMDAVTVWGGKSGVVAKAESESQALRMACREALGGLLEAQRHLRRPEGGRGADANVILAGEIDAAIGAIRSAGVRELQVGCAAGVGCEGRYGAALACLAAAEKALVGVKGAKQGDEARRRVLLHVRTAKWWVEPRATPRYGRVLAGR